MRILLILIFIGFSLGAMATFDGLDKASEISSARATYAQAVNLIGVVASVGKFRSHLSADERQAAWSEPAQGGGLTRLRFGETLPEGTEFYEIPRHESYRYANVQGYRVIVDAASHQIIYILR
jgi:Protein of unknown function (DUF1236)